MKVSVSIPLRFKWVNCTVLPMRVLLMVLVTRTERVCVSKPRAEVSSRGMYSPIRQSLDANSGLVPVWATAWSTV